MAHAIEAPAAQMAEGQTSHTLNQADGLAALRVQFPREQINPLPKISCRACSQSQAKNCDRHRKIKCKECDNWITEQHVHLPYVGHAELTNRLLDADPLWSWEPLATDERGLPQFDGYGGLWIRLTVCGHTRLGYGDADGKKGANAIKEAIGDALRNAAMRFGAALDLWAKSDLTAASVEHPKSAEEDVPAVAGPGRSEPVDDSPAEEPDQRLAVLDKLYLQAVNNRSSRDVLTQVRGAAEVAGVLGLKVEGPPPERRRMPFRELLDLLEGKPAQGGQQTGEAA